MKLRPFAAVILLVLFAGNASAQVQLSPEEMFRWFPAGKYMAASYKNNLAAQNSDGFHKLKGLDFIHQYWEETLLLPPALKKHWTHLTEMTSVKIVVKMSEKPTQAGRGGVLITYSVNGDKYVVNHFGFALQVINFPEDIKLHKMLSEQREVEKTEDIIKNIPLYFVKDNFRKSSKEDFYLAVAPENVVLSCVSKDHLKRMIQAGYNDIPNVYVDFPFPNLMDMLPSLHDSWQFSSYEASYNALMQKLEKDGVPSSKTEGLGVIPSSINDYIFSSPPSSLKASLPDDTFLPSEIMFKAMTEREKVITSGGTSINRKLFKHHYVEAHLTIYTDEYVAKQNEILRKARERRDKNQKKEEKSK